MKKILLVETDEMIIGNTSDFLRTEGFSVFSCSNIKEGIRLATEVVPDVIISDLNMPEGGEFEICKAIQSDAVTSHIPVILITERPQDVLTGMQIGVEDFLPKPFSFKQLLDTISNVFLLQPSFIPVNNSKEFNININKKA